jgi:hypothetical protein
MFSGQAFINKENATRSNHLVSVVDMFSVSIVRAPSRGSGDFKSGICRPTHFHKVLTAEMMMF